MALSGYKTLLIAATLIPVSTSCSTLPPNAQQYDSFADYAETVFRRENDLISRIMMMTDGDTLPDSDSLEDAEQSMNDACYLLNEYAERESNGDSMGLFFKHKVRASIENCDRKIQTLEALVADLEKSPQAEAIE